MRKIHILNSGDSIETVNALYNINLKEMNVVKNSTAGNYVAISEGTDDFLVVQNYNPIVLYKVQDGDTLMDIIARGYEVLDGDIVPNEYIALRRPSGYKHIVKPAENINNIAKLYGTTVQALVDKNNLKTTRLYVGQILSI